MSISPPLERTDLDLRIWKDELDDYVPRQVYDVHTHIYRWEHNKDPNKDRGAMKPITGATFAEASWDLADRCDAMLMPGREVHRLAFPFPFPHPCDFEASNAYLAQQVKKDPQSAGLMLVHPGMSAKEVEAGIDKYSFKGFKPYRFYAASGDAVNCGIPDFMPEHQIEVAHRRGLIIMMHVSKRDAIADPDNIADMLRLCERYPNARWILAHCARSYSSWAIDAAAKHLRGLPNVWYDTSSVCESDAMEALYAGVGADRVMYGSDDIPIGVLRGKYVAFGRAWSYLSETNHMMNLSACDARMTFTRYEQLRAMCRAARRMGLTRQQNEAMFRDTALKLVASVGNKLP